MLVLVAAMIWAARSHLKTVLHSAFTRDYVADDADEILSYRSAVFVWAGCAVYVFGWFVMTGLPPLSTFVFLIGAFVIFLAIARVVAQGGEGRHRAQAGPSLQ